MGKGIAVEFKRRFSSVAALKAQDKQIGEVASLHLTANQQASFASDIKLAAPTSGFQDRSIYYMITKQKYFHKPTLDDFTLSLKALRDAAVADNVTALAMPKIGCGLDKLDWNVVKGLIAELFAGTNIEISVYCK